MQADAAAESGEPAAQLLCRQVTSQCAAADKKKAQAAKAKAAKAKAAKGKGDGVGGGKGEGAGEERVAVHADYASLYGEGHALPRGHKHTRARGSEL